MKTKCVTCGKREVRTGPALPYSRTVAGHEFNGSVPGRACSACGEKYYNGPELVQFDLRVAAELARSGTTNGEAIRFMRRSAGMKATDLADLLGVTPETVSRWENGKLAADRRTIALLGSIVNDIIAGRSYTVDWLHSLIAPPKLGKKVKVPTARSKLLKHDSGRRP